MIAESVVEGALGTGSVFTASGENYLTKVLHLNNFAIPGRILDGHDQSNFTLSRAAEPSIALSRLSSCLVSTWSRMRLDTPDHLEKCAASSAKSVAGLDVTLAAVEEIISSDGATLLPALETLDPQAVFFLQYAQSLCSLMTLQQRDLDRASHQQLLAREKLSAVLSQFVQFKHFYFCSEESDNLCDTSL